MSAEALDGWERQVTELCQLRQHAACPKSYQKPAAFPEHEDDMRGWWGCMCRCHLDDE